MAGWLFVDQPDSLQPCSVLCGGLSKMMQSITSLTPTLNSLSQKQTIIHHGGEMWALGVLLTLPVRPVIVYTPDSEPSPVVRMSATVSIVPSPPHCYCVQSAQYLSLWSRLVWRCSRVKFG